MKSQTAIIQEQYEHFVMHTYPTSDVAFVRGAGCRLWDAEGREYLDFASGISVCNLGHCHPNVTRAIAEQAAVLVHVSNLFLNENQGRLAQKMIERTFDGRCFFCNSGAEANEGLIKFARKWGNPQGKNEIIVMEDSFHGRTLAALAATGRAKYRKGFEPDMPGFVHVPFNDLNAVKAAVSPKTCAVLLEAIQGEGGILPADMTFMKALREFCDQAGILLLCDEVQCGMGRTGTLWGWQHYGIEPDGFSAAKAIGNGFPIGMFVLQRKHEGVLTPGTHASTFGGTPLASAAAIAVLDTMDEEKILENVQEVGEYLKTSLSALKNELPVIQSVRGLGLMIGVVLDRAPAPILGRLRAEGLLALPAGETVLRLLPPLNITKADADRAVDMIRRVLLAEMVQV